MKNASNYIFVVLIGLIIFSIFNSKNETEFFLIQSNTLNNGMQIYHYENNKVINSMLIEDEFKEKVYENSTVLLFSEYSNELIEYIDGSPKTYAIVDEPVQIRDIDDIRYVLSKGNSLSSVFVKYDDNFNKLDDGIEFDGVPVNLTYLDGYFYILTNCYDDDYNIYTKIYKYNILSEIIEHEWVIDEFIYGFFITNDNGIIKTYGHVNEETKRLSVYEYDTLTLSETRTDYNEYVMWVSDVLFIEEAEYVISNNLVLKIKDNEIKKVIRTEYDFIDFGYSVIDDYIYILAGDYNTNQFVVNMVDLDFDNHGEISVSVENQSPLSIIIPTKSTGNIFK